MIAHVRDLDDVARVRRVDELSAADVDPHVPEAAEEDEVSRLQVAVRDRRSIAVHGSSVVRQGNADLGVDVHDESGAVEAARPAGAPDIWLPELLHCEPDDPAVL